MAAMTFGKLFRRPRRVVVKRVRLALRTARERGDWRALARMYRLWLVFRPKDSAAWARLAQARRESGAPGAAARAWERAVGLAPPVSARSAADHYAGRLHLAGMAKAAGNASEASDAFAALLRERPADPEPFAQLKALGHRERALVIVRELQGPGRSKPGPAGAGGLAIFTIASNNYMAQARVLIDGARAHYPGAKVFLCLADRALDPRLTPPDEAEILLSSEVGVPAFDRFAFRYGPTEFHTALKPFVLRYLLGERGFGQALYYDPDILVCAPSTSVLAKLATGASIVATPHLSRPMEGRAAPSDLAMLRAGVFNLGFLGAAATEEALGVLDWWANRLEFDCRNEPQEGVFVDQKFIDLLPIYAPSFAVERSPGANLAYWNLGEHRLEAQDGAYAVDGAPLEFFHFSGYGLDRPNRLTRHSQEYAAVEPGPLLDLMNLYRQRLLANGFETAKDIPLSYETFADGAPIPWLVRRFFRETYALWPGDPFVDFQQATLAPAAGTGIPAFLDYLREREGELRTICDEGARGARIGRWLRSNSERLGLSRDLGDRLLKACPS